MPSEPAFHTTEKKIKGKKKEMGAKATSMQLYGNYK